MPLLIIGAVSLSLLLIKTRNPGLQFKQQSRFFLLSLTLIAPLSPRSQIAPDPSLLFRTAVAAELAWDSGHRHKCKFLRLVICEFFFSMGNFPLICRISQDSSLLPIFIIEALCCMEIRFLLSSIIWAPGSSIKKLSLQNTGPFLRLQLRLKQEIDLTTRTWVSAT